MDLAQVFLAALGNKIEYQDVVNALFSVDEVFSKMLPEGASEDDSFELFFEKGDVLCPRKEYYNLMNLWRVIEPHIWDQPSEPIRHFWALRTMRELETIRQVTLYNQILEGETKGHLHSLQKLTDSIEDIIDKQYAVEIDEAQNECIIRAVYPLKYAECDHAYREYFCRKLYLLLSQRGVLVIVASESADGRAPQKFFKYRLKEFGWEIEPINDQESCKKILEENKDAMRRTLINGFTWEELW